MRVKWCVFLVLFQRLSPLAKRLSHSYQLGPGSRCFGALQIAGLLRMVPALTVALATRTHDRARRPRAQRASVGAAGIVELLHRTPINSPVPPSSTTPPRPSPCAR